MTELEQLAVWEDDLAAIDVRQTDPQQPYWLNAWLYGLDAASIYGYLRSSRPRRYIEIGSGNSTMFAARAKRDGGLPTLITSIDPSPRVHVDELCDEMVRRPLEDVPLEIFGELGPNDMIFVDNSHRVFMNSDVTAFFLDVLPELSSGVLVGVHDILLPDDYLPEWAEHWFSEQYLLAAYLLGEAQWLEPVLACHYVSQHPRLSRVLSPLWQRLGVPERETRGFAFWLRIRH
jgi:predicted O-methyltransferase YrrM